MSKKAQYALPIILVSMIGLMLIYLIMVHPAERAELLPPVGIPEEDRLMEEVGGKKSLFSSGEFVEIGHATGEIVFDYELEDAYVNYPIKERVLDSMQINPRTSILRSDSQTLLIRNIDIENTNDLSLRLNVTDLKGSQKIEVSINETIVFYENIEIGEMEITIPKNLLEEGNEVVLTFNHRGYFWSRDYSNIQIDIVQAYYSAEKPTESKTIPLSRSNLVGSEIRLSFFPTEAIEEGELIVKINDRIIFSERIEENELIIISEKLYESGLRVGQNEIVFEADKGGVYNLTDIKLQFVAARTPVSEHVYSFDIERKDLETWDDIVLGVRTNRIIQPGYISIQVGVDGPTYYLSQEELVAGSWSYLTLEKHHLTEWGNMITVGSPTGRYRIDGFIVFLR